MPLYLLNQNMRAYGGGTQVRTNAYHGTAPMPAPHPVTWPNPPPPNGFAPLVTGLPQGGTVCVAGLTELTNGGLAVAAVSGLFTTIFKGVAPTSYAVIRTILSAGDWQEYLAIGINGVTPLAIGRVSVVPKEDPICEEHRVAAPPPPVLRPPWWNTLPSQNAVIAAALDYQSIVYVKVRLPAGGPVIAVCFTHNTNTLDTHDTFLQLVPKMLRSVLSGVGVTRVYLGGDFNALPPTGVRGKRVLEVWPYHTPIGPPLFPGARPGGTTFGGGMIDYWFSDIDPQGLPAPLIPNGVNYPVATTYTNTMDFDARAGAVPRGWMSDHAAIALQIT